jgi:hypothetical protein
VIGDLGALRQRLVSKITLLQRTIRLRDWCVFPPRFDFRDDRRGDRQQVIGCACFTHQHRQSVTLPSGYFHIQIITEGVVVRLHIFRSIDIINKTYLI